MYNILFIGNSHTYVNNLPEIFKNIAKSAGIEVNVAAVTNGGWSLERHASIDDVYGSATDAVLKGRKFDFVVLQEQSTRPAAEPEKFRAAVEILLEKIKENGASPFLYCTWGHKTGSAALEKYGWTTESMTEKVAESFDVVGNAFGIPVAHVGKAFFDVSTNHGEIELYAPDCLHASKYGSFLAALAIFAKIFNRDVRDVKYNYIFTEEEAKILKEAVR